MSSNPLVSIVIPVYNGANYVAEAIESALAQTYSNIEVVVVDDGSTDGGATRKVIESFGSRVRFVTKPNGGVATALNSGIANMHGSLFSWLSHDDLYRPEKVERQVERWLDFGSPCIVIGDFETMDENTAFRNRVSIKGYNLVARPLDAVFRGLINGCALLVPRDLFDRAGLFEPGLPTTQDYHLWYRMARLVPFVHCPYSDVRQRMHALQGSRHSSHLDEASRMFAHLVDSTPVRIMQAYDGSELAFLLNVRRVLSPYPGLRSYLTFRIEELLRKKPYSLVLCSDDGEDAPEGGEAALTGLKIPPEAVVRIRRGKAQRDRLKGSKAPIIPAGTSAADVLMAAYKALPAGYVLFFQAHPFPSAGQILESLEYLLEADGDIAKPGNVPETSSELNGLVVRHEALPALAEAIGASRFEWKTIRRKLQVSDYDFIDPVRVQSPEQITQAWRGKERVLYHRGLSEDGVARLALDAFENPELPILLFILHSLGGGSQTHVNSLVQALGRKANCLIGYGGPNGELRLTTSPEGSEHGMIFRIPGQLSDLVRILHRIGVQRVDVHHTAGFENETEMLLDALGIPFDLTLLDYHLLANNPFLCASDGRFVGDKRLRHLEFNLLRRTPLPILRKASRVIAISRDLAARVNHLCPGLPLIPARLWHDTQARVRHVFAPRLYGSEPLRVLIVGLIQPHKGQELLTEVAREVSIRGLPIRFHLMGEIKLSPNDREDTVDALTVHGRFAEGKFSETLGSIAPHIGWLPSQVPETWSYVLTDLMEAGLPITATAIGAIPERCHERPYTWLLPLEATASEWVDLFLRLHATALKEPPRWAPVEHLPPVKALYFEEYLRPGG